MTLCTGGLVVFWLAVAAAVYSGLRNGTRWDQEAERIFGKEGE